MNSSLIESSATMWIRLYKDHSSSPMSCVVGKDGILYWRVVDVGFLCQMSKPYDLQRSSYVITRSVMGADILSEGLACYSFQSKCGLINTSTALETLKSKSPEMYDHFLFILKTENFSVTNEHVKFGKSYSDCHVLKPHPTGVTFESWLEQFIESARDNRMIMDDSGEMNIPSNSGMESENQVWKDNLNDGSQLVRLENSRDVIRANPTVGEERSLATAAEERTLATAADEMSREAQTPKVILTVDETTQTTDEMSQTVDKDPVEEIFFKQLQQLYKEYNTLKQQKQFVEQALQSVNVGKQNVDTDIFETKKIC
nr:uncharacterized protein LOC122273767 [Parasteatoda tepidariorum]